MQVKISELSTGITDKKTYNQFVTIKANSTHVVMYRHYSILIMDLGHGRMVLNVTYAQRMYIATVFDMSVDYVIGLVPTFLKAVKAGHDSFEVQ